MRHNTPRGRARRAQWTPAAALSLDDVRRSAAVLVGEIPADRFSLSSVAQHAGVDLDQVRHCVPDTATLVAVLHQHWYQRLAVRLDALLESTQPGRTRLDALVNVWLDLALETPGWPGLLQRFSAEPPVREQIRHQLDRLTDIIAIDLLVDGRAPGTGPAARLLSALPALALHEADIGHRCPELRRHLIASATATSPSTVGSLVG